MIEDARGQRVRHDLKDGPRFHGIGVDQLRLDEGHCAYPAELDDGRWVVVRDGRPGEAYDAIGDLALSGPRVLYAAERAGKWFVVRDGEAPLGPWDDVLAGSLRLAGETWAFAGKRGPQSFVVVDGSELGPFEGVGQFTWHRGELLFVARAAEGAYLYTGARQRVGPFDEIADLTTGEHLAYSVRRGDRWRVGDGPLFERVSGLTFDSGELVYAGRRDGGDWVVHGERELGPFTALKKRLGVSSAGPFFAAHHGGAWWVLRGADRLGPWQNVTALVTANGHDAFIALRGGRSIVVLDGVEQASWDEAASLVFSPDGARLMFAARKGVEALLVVDGAPTRYDLILSDTLAFSRDGRHHAFVAGEAKSKRLYIAVDGSERVPVDVEELTAAVSRMPLTELYTPDGAVLSRWVQAELDLRFAAPKRKE